MTPKPFLEGQEPGLLLGLLLFFVGVVHFFAGKEGQALTWWLTSTAVLWLAMELASWHKVFLYFVALEARFFVFSALGALIFIFRRNF